MNQPALSLKEKLSYGLGDAASNIVYQMVVNYLLYFYTDVYGIEAAAAGTLMLAVRLFDAVTDPMMGAIADRTKSRWGRYRPWMLWIAVPYGALAIAAFFTPDVGIGTKLVYAYISYALLMTAYTAVNIPYSALGGVITFDTQERADVQTWRFAMAMVGGVLVTASVLPLVSLFGGGNEQLGFPLAMTVMALVAILFFFGCFAFTREREQIDESKSSHSILTDIWGMLSNRQWQIIAIVTVVFWIRDGMKGAVTPYYVNYYLNSENLIGLFISSGMIAAACGALFCAWLVKRLCKVTIIKIGIAGMMVTNGLFYFVPQDGVYAAFVLSLLSSFTQMMFVSMLFSTIPDTVDYGLKKTGKGAMAMFFSGHLLALKLGIAIGGASTGWTLNLFGYVPNEVQTESALQGIMHAFAGSALVAGVLVLFIMRFYKLTKGWKDRADI
ncbi:MAG: MFS transporter [Acidobacteria bacterium]|nr:MFS transporter [Acidobacteriota bacterium]